MIKDIITAANDTATPLPTIAHKLFQAFNITYSQVTDVAYSDFFSSYASTMRMFSQEAKELQSIIDNVYLVGYTDSNILSDPAPDTLTRNEALTLQEADPYDGLIFYAVDFRLDVTPTRQQLAALTRCCNRMAKEEPVIVLARYKSPHRDAENVSTPNRALSLSTCERTRDYVDKFWNNEHLDRLGRVSLLRDIDCLNPHRGHLDILQRLSLRSFSKFDDLYHHWINTFDTSLLSQRFYDDLLNWYLWAKDPSSGVSFPNVTDTPNDDRDNLGENVTRLITRLIFVWFIKQIRRSNGVSLVPGRLFDPIYLKEHVLADSFDPQDPVSGDYYNAILQNLFFATLNKPINDEDNKPRRFTHDTRRDLKNFYRYAEMFKISEEEVVKLFADVPFLNGGLFECLDKDIDKGNDYNGDRIWQSVDGFSRRDICFPGTKRPKYRAVVPNILFFHPDRGIFSILRRYYFTVEESTPADQDVSLDPELLGNVFENLLAEQNPETHESARKQTGSFYTPKAIVNYMVDQALLAHIQNKCQQQFPNVVTYVQALLAPAAQPLTQAEQDDNSNINQAIVNALYDCKIIDPACGSGAFPMGCLNQILRILRLIDPQNTLWLNAVIGRLTSSDDDDTNSKVNAVRQLFHHNELAPDYTRKLYLIKDCIFGVDIQPIAVQISKLRFFISLVAEQHPNDDPSTNFGIIPLPNLDTKFIAANTLVPALIRSVKEFNTDNEIAQLFSNSYYGRLNALKKQLLDVRSQIFSAHNRRTKTKLKDRERDLRKEIEKEFTDPESGNKLKDNDPVVQAIRQITAWNPYDQNASASFLDPEWMLDVPAPGFDIVIGNPPYIQLQNNGGALARHYEPLHYHTFCKTGDIYSLFYERGIDLLRGDGHLCFITSNKWMRAAYGQATRDFFANHTNPLLLIDFAGVRIFNSATVDTNILLLAKQANQHHTLALAASRDKRPVLHNLDAFVAQNATPTPFNSSDAWVILSPIERSIKQKIEAAGTPLKDWDVQINYGIKTGLNDAFIITTAQRDQILLDCRDNAERDRTQELIRPILRGRDIKRYGYEWADKWLIATFPARHYDIEQYPAVRDFLLTFGKERLEQTGKTYTIDGQTFKARKKTHNKWFETQDSISYWDDFSKPKILWKRVGSILRFAYNVNGFFGLDSTCFSTGDNIEYICCVLNSPMGHYLLKDSPKTGTGDLLVSVQAIEPLRIPHISEDENKFFRTRLEILINEESNALEQEINQKVFDLYDLSLEERNYVKRDFS